MSQQIDVMFDLETLGVRTDSSVLSIGAVVFNSYGLGQEFYVEINPEQPGRNIDINTIKWWQQQSIPMPINGVVSLRDAFEDFLTNYLFGVSAIENTNNLITGNKKIILWCNGTDFDWGITRTVIDTYGIEHLIRYDSVRDYRTISKLFPDIPKPKTVQKHNALEDAKYQALHAIDILNSINYWRY